MVEQNLQFGGVLRHVHRERLVEAVGHPQGPQVLGRKAIRPELGAGGKLQQVVELLVVVAYWDQPDAVGVAALRLTGGLGGAGFIHTREQTNVHGSVGPVLPNIVHLGRDAVGVFLADLGIAHSGLIVDSNKSLHVGSSFSWFKTYSPSVSQVLIAQASAACSGSFGRPLNNSSGA